MTTLRKLRTQYGLSAMPPMDAPDSLPRPISDYDPSLIHGRELQDLSEQRRAATGRFGRYGQPLGDYRFAKVPPGRAASPLSTLLQTPTAGSGDVPVQQISSRGGGRASFGGGRITQPPIDDINRPLDPNEVVPGMAPAGYVPIPMPPPDDIDRPLDPNEVAPGMSPPGYKPIPMPPTTDTPGVHAGPIQQTRKVMGLDTGGGSPLFGGYGGGDPNAGLSVAEAVNAVTGENLGSELGKGVFGGMLLGQNPFALGIAALNKGLGTSVSANTATDTATDPSTGLTPLGQMTAAQSAIDKAPQTLVQHALALTPLAKGAQEISNEEVALSQTLQNMNLTSPALEALTEQPTDPVPAAVPNLSTPIELSPMQKSLMTKAPVVAPAQPSEGMGFTPDPQAMSGLQADLEAAHAPMTAEEAIMGMPAAGQPGGIGPSGGTSPGGSMGPPGTPGMAGMDAGPGGPGVK